MANYQSATLGTAYPKIECKYELAIITKANLDIVYGIAVKDAYEDNVVCVKEIGSDKDNTQYMVDILNNYRIPHVHFLDIINDLINE